MGWESYEIPSPKKMPTHSSCISIKGKLLLSHTPQDIICSLRFVQAAITTGLVCRNLLKAQGDHGEYRQQNGLGTEALNRLSREAVGAPSLKVFKARLAGV